MPCKDTVSFRLVKIELIGGQPIGGGLNVLGSNNFCLNKNVFHLLNFVQFEGG